MTSNTFRRHAHFTTWHWAGGEAPRCSWIVINYVNSNIVCMRACAVYVCLYFCAPYVSAIMCFLPDIPSSHACKDHLTPWRLVLAHRVLFLDTLHTECYLTPCSSVCRQLISPSNKDPASLALNIYVTYVFVFSWPGSYPPVSSVIDHCLPPRGVGTGATVQWEQFPQCSFPNVARGD